MITQTKSTKSQRAEDIKREWHLIDISNQILGRASTRITQFLQGKHKRNFSSNLDSGDYVVVINAKKVRLSGKKTKTKIYTRYSGYPGGLKRETFTNLIERKPEEVVRRAVSGMLPKNKLRDRRLSRLFIFEGDKHKFGDKFNNKK